MKKISEISNEAKLRIIMYMGMVIRLYYIIASPVIQSRQYDLGTASPEENILTGHLGYIYYLNINKHFPDFDPRQVYQFFHPPLHHIIEALWMSVIKLFTNTQSVIVEWLQVPTFIYSCVILLAVLGIVKELKLGEKASLITMIIVAFQPSLIFMAGSLNNDGLTFMFQFLIIYMTIKWYNHRNSFNIMMLALYFGLGMLSKLSAGMLAVPVAFVFLYVFVEEWIKNKKFPIESFWQYVIFGIICIPLGLAWAVRCLILFDMPLNYVNHLPEDSWQYVGNYSMIQRFFIPNPVGFISNLAHGRIGYGENMWVQLFRTAALGECDLQEFPFVAKILLMLMVVIAFIIALACFIAFVRVFVFGKENDYSCLSPAIRLFMIIMYVVLFGCFVSFCVNYPHQCTMNFRYIVPLVLTPAMSLGMIMENKNNLMSKIINICLGAYVVMSVITIVIWGCIN